MAANPTPPPAKSSPPPAGRTQASATATQATGREASWPPLLCSPSNCSPPICHCYLILLLGTVAMPRIPSESELDVDACRRRSSTTRWPARNRSPAAPTFRRPTTPSYSLAVGHIERGRDEVEAAQVERGELAVQIERTRDEGEAAHDEGVSEARCESEWFRVVPSIWRYEQVPDLGRIFGLRARVGYCSSCVPNARTRPRNTSDPFHSSRLPELNTPLVVHLKYRPRAIGGNSRFDLYWLYMSIVMFLVLLPC